MPSNIEETKSLLEQSLEVQRETVGVLRGIEGILDDIASTLEVMQVDQQDMLYYTLPFWRRWSLHWRHASEMIKLTEAEGRAAQDGTNPH